MSMTWKCPRCGSEFDTVYQRRAVACYCVNFSHGTPMILVEADADICDGYVLRVVPSWG